MSPLISIVGVREKKEIKRLTEEGCHVLDVSMRSKHPVWAKFSPAYPHGDIPVPGMPGHTSLSVEGIWQGLKTFTDGSGVDASRFRARGGITRTQRKFGDIAGFKFGDVIITEQAARYQIFIPSYMWVLHNALAIEMNLMAEQLHMGKRIVFLDHTASEDASDMFKRFSHAAIIKAVLLSVTTGTATVAAPAAATRPPDATQ